MSPPASTRKNGTCRRVAGLLCCTLAVLSLISSTPVAAADATTENFLVHTFTVNSQRAHKNYVEARCSKTMDIQPVWPNTNATFKYFINYGGGKKHEVRVPTTLFQHDYSVVSGKNPSSDEYVKEPVEAQPTILAEFCAELPYLLYRMWPQKSPLDRASGDLFKVANHGCALLRSMFRADKQHYAKSPSCNKGNVCQRITKSANCYNTIAQSVAHVINTYTDELELRQAAKPGAPNPRNLSINKNLFQDKRTVDTVKALETVRENLIARVKKIAEMDNGPQVLAAIAQVPPFAALGDVTSPKFAQNSIPVFAKTLTVFMLAVEAEMLAQRIRRTEETFPWTSPVHKIRASFNLNRQDARNLAMTFDKTDKGHFSFDVSFPTTPIKSMVAAIGGKGMEYTAGEANQCDLFNPVVTTAINGNQWFHGSLSEGAVRLKNGVNAPMFTVNWFLPPAPKTSKDVTPRKVRKALVESVQEKTPVTMSIELAVTTSVGSKACPNLPIIPASIFPAYACADSYQTRTSQPLRSMADSAFAGEYYLGEPQFSAEDTFFEDDFVDEDAAGDFAFGDELDEDALDEDAAQEYALGDDSFADEDLDADFSMSEEDFADEDGADGDFSLSEEDFADEADFSAEDALFADNSADSYAASYADSSLFE